MSYSLGEAAKATGKAKSTILRAIKTGRISASKKDGSYSIDPSELFRVFDATVAEQRHRTKRNRLQNTRKHSNCGLELAEKEREREREQMQATIDDLRTRLDRSEDRITALAGRSARAGTPPPVVATAEVRLTVWPALG